MSHRESLHAEVDVLTATPTDDAVRAFLESEAAGVLGPRELRSRLVEPFLQARGTPRDRFAGVSTSFREFRERFFPTFAEIRAGQQRAFAHRETWTTEGGSLYIFTGYDASMDEVSEPRLYVTHFPGLQGVPGYFERNGVASLQFQGMEALRAGVVMTEVAAALSNDPCITQDNFPDAVERSKCRMLPQGPYQIQGTQLTDSKGGNLPAHLFYPTPNAELSCGLMVDAVRRRYLVLGEGRHLSALPLPVRSAEVDTFRDLFKKGYTHLLLNNDPYQEAAQA